MCCALYGRDYHTCGGKKTWSADITLSHELFPENHASTSDADRVLAINDFSSQNAGTTLVAVRAGYPHPTQIDRSAAMTEKALLSASRSSSVPQVYELFDARFYFQDSYVRSTRKCMQQRCFIAIKPDGVRRRLQLGIRHRINKRIDLVKDVCEANAKWNPCRLEHFDLRYVMHFIGQL
ncbi:hypothetical protein Taro_043753 [Colocasia esculenta]|uniref:Uncharacterized protein n=1 Tax=Colocasia esculenta TaxID=4460 RepID=A0A843X1B0_COLES|nr:hypothetical protein [Colocasia esculenta]